MAYNCTMKSSSFVNIVSLAALALLIPTLARAQDGGEAQRAFEAGQYQQVVDAAAPGSPPEVVYLAAQSAQRLGATERAVQMFGQLAQRPQTDPWHFIGVSGRQLVEEQVDASIASARQAVGLAPQEAAAHYQLGLAVAKQQLWPDAAAAFDAAIERQPTFAYSYYYAGLMYSRANRPDLMATRFDQFLKLAPEAPERPEVMSIMRTIRKR